MATEVTIVDEVAWKQAMARVRSDSDDTNWAVFTHENQDPSRVKFIADGKGGASEFAEEFKDDGVFYGLLRMEHTIDMSTAIKFIYVHWVGTSVPFAKRGRFGVVSGSVKNLFNPFHLNIETNIHSDLSESNVMTLMEETAGTTKNKVLDASEGISRPERGFTSSSSAKRGSGIGSSNNYSSTSVQKVSSSGGAVNFDEQVAGVIADVRNDSSETTWCLVSYQDDNFKKPYIIALGSGTGTIEEINDVGLLKDNMVAYGLYRVTDVVDDIPTVKFVYIQWVGNDVKPLSKAKISTHKGALEEMFYPTHVTFFVTSTSEITQAAVMDKVMSASGSKSHVK